MQLNSLYPKKLYHNYDKPSLPKKKRVLRCRKINYLIDYSVICRTNGRKLRKLWQLVTVSEYMDTNSSI